MSYVGQGDVRGRERRSLLDERGPSSNVVPRDFIDGFSVLDGMPLPFGVIELRHEDDGSVDFTDRYCNDRMAAFWDRESEDLVGLRFDDPFWKDESGWLTNSTDVALYGETGTIGKQVTRWEDGGGPLLQDPERIPRLRDRGFLRYMMHPRIRNPD